MNVKELMEHLKQCDPRLPVLFEYPKCNNSNINSTCIDTIELQTSNLAVYIRITS